MMSRLPALALTLALFAPTSAPPRPTATRCC